MIKLEGEEVKGHAKVTIDVEINEHLMDLMKESMTKMPQMLKAIEKRTKEE